jgi:hypothetical protein
MVVENDYIDHAIRTQAGNQRVAQMMKVATSKENRTMTNGQRTIQRVREFAVYTHPASKSDSLLPIAHRQ